MTERSRVKKREPLRRRFAVAMYAMIFCTLVGFTLLTSFLIGNYLQRTGQATAKRQIEQTSEILDMFYTMQIKKTDFIQFNPELFRLLSLEPASVSEVIAARKELGQWLERIAFDIRYPELETNHYYGGGCVLSLYVKNDALTPTTSGLDKIMPYSAAEETAWYEELMKLDKTLAWESGILISGVRYVAIYRRVFDSVTMQDTAILRICVPVAKIQDVLQKNKVPDAQFIMYADGNNRLIWSEGQVQNIEASVGSDFATVQYNQKSFLLYTCRSALNGWSLTCAVPTSRFWYGIQNMVTGFACAVLVAAAVSIWASRRLAKTLTARLELLVGKTLRLGGGDFDVFDSVGGNDEIARLDNYFMDMANRIQIFDKRELDYRMRLADIRFRLLQEQINPHLLYNTLAMIRLSARRENHEEISVLANNLIMFYRHMLSRGSLTYTIAEEVEMVRYYAKVAVSVYQLDVQVNFDVEQQVLDLWFIKLFLQPIVENAIIHGIKPYHTGRVDITGRLNDGKVSFVVADTGTGITEEVLRQIREDISLSDTAGQPVKHYGIYNVARRIRLLFGTEYGLTIESSLDAGTTVQIDIPAFNDQDIAMSRAL